MIGPNRTRLLIQTIEMYPVMILMIKAAIEETLRLRREVEALRRAPGLLPPEEPGGTL